MNQKRNMDRHHRINVWRIADCCPVCGEERDYSPANAGGIEMYCSNDNCGFSEFFSNEFIHNNGTQNDNARFEVLDSNNKVRDGWRYLPNEYEKQKMVVIVKKRKQENEQLERDKHKIYSNLGDDVYCRKIEHTLKIKKCKGCKFCEELGIEENGMSFSKCVHPFRKLRQAGSP